MAQEIPSRFNIAEWFLDRPAEAHPERIAILGEPRAVCYGELRELANRVGNALLAGGCARGDPRADCVRAIRRNLWRRFLGLRRLARFRFR